ncbi:hypothetical protein [uncultured Dialister sp.]|nr:hypothetical protein [uncultured Dialister sp.]
MATIHANGLERLMDGTIKEKSSWKEYIGVKIIKAEPEAARKDYHMHSKGEDGYKVVYPDGYESWSPKKVFEEAYRKLKGNELLTTAKPMFSADLRDRFRAKYLQLKIRKEKLDKMLEGYKAGTLPFHPKCSYELLKSQSDTMGAYLKILEERARIENVPLEE